MSLYLSCFISYAGPDQKFARRVNDFLHQAGVKTWAWFEQGKLGEWRPLIQEALDSHECIVLILSAAAIKKSGVQDENRLALADDLRPYYKRLLPIILEDMNSIRAAASNPEEKELVNIVTRVTCIDVHSPKGPRLTRRDQEKLLHLLQRPVARVMVMGSVSQEDESENRLKRPFIHALARSIGKYMALDTSKPICMATRGGGIDPFVCEGFRDSSTKHDVQGRLWVYPEVRDVVGYTGEGREVRFPVLSSVDTSGRIITEMTRVKIVISSMAVEADTIIAIRGGKGVEHAAVMALAQGKRMVVAPGLGGAGDELYRLCRNVGILAPEICLRTPSSWEDRSEEVEVFAEALVRAALHGKTS